MAQSKIQQEQNEQIIDEATVLAGTPYENKNVSLQALRALLGIKVMKIYKHLTENRIYEVIVEKKDGTLSSVIMSSAQLLRYDTFETKMMDVASEVLKILPKGGWGKVKKLISLIVEEKAIPRESTSEGIVEEWIQDYMRNQPIRDLETAIEEKKAFFHTDGYWYLFATTLHEWAQDNKRSKENKYQLTRIMKKLDIEYQAPNYYKPDGTRSSCAAWKLPHSIVQPRSITKIAGNKASNVRHL